MTYKQAMYQELFLEIEATKKAINHLEYAFERCKETGIKNEYSTEELMIWEAFTSRHARLCDILTQKVLNNILLIETQKKGTVTDKANFAVANNFIATIEDFRSLRNIRNHIAHEYMQEEPNKIFSNIFNSYSLLKSFANKIISFYETNNIYKL
jgi:hypothetical protein